MARPWLGRRTIAVFPAAVDDPAFPVPPANWAELVQQRLYYDPHPTSGVDRSLRSYIHTISYGNALLDADVFPPVDVGPCDINGVIEANATAHAYETACVVFMAHCTGWSTLSDRTRFRSIHPDGQISCRIGAKFIWRS
jgi:hypothetical protein